jgi:hypothetical protein
MEWPSRVEGAIKDLFREVALFHCPPMGRPKILRDIPLLRGTKIE